MHRMCGGKLGEIMFTLKLFFEMNECPDPSIVINDVSFDLVNGVSYVDLNGRMELRTWANDRERLGQFNVVKSWDSSRFPCLDKLFPEAR